MTMSKRLLEEKKKSQEVMRRLMAERKKKNIKTMKIDNPLAKYNNAGQLMCVLCSSIVRSENVWPVHLNSKNHKENVDKAKKLKELTNNFTVGKTKAKRHSSPSMDPPPPPEKKIKGILKKSELPTNSVAITSIPKPSVDSKFYHSEEIKRLPLNTALLTLNNKNIKEDVLKQSTSKLKKDDSVDDLQMLDHPIPEGFFDDPILDAKVRNIEYKDPVEEEWEKFQKEIKDETSASAEIIAGEQEEATAERQIDEIDEQIRNWSRVLELEMKKEETKQKQQESELMSEDENADSDNEDDIDEFLDWRAKKALYFPKK